MLLAMLAAACVIRYYRCILGPANAGHYDRGDVRSVRLQADHDRSVRLQADDDRSVRLQADHTPRRKRVLHVISSHGAGAQVQLAEILNRTPRDQYEAEVLVLEDLEQWPRLAPSVFAIVERCRANQYDLVHTWAFMANVVGVAGARLAGVPRVVTSVRSLSVWKREAWYRRWWHRAADILNSNAADVVTVNAQALVGDHASWAWTRRSRIEVVHGGLDPSRFLVDRRASRQVLLDATGFPEEALIVGTVGRLAPEKDQETFVRMIAEARKWRPEIRGVVIGGGELRGNLETIAHRLALDFDNSLVFLGERADARRLMAGLDLFALTSVSEGFSNVLLEATLLGVPCVATNVGGNAEVLKLEEALFPPREVTQGAMRVLCWLADREWTATRQQFVRQRAMELFTAERSAGAWLSLYRRVCGDA
jgi:glycosyltransferase involved in cell wall biosynthesis